MVVVVRFCIFSPIVVSDIVIIAAIRMKVLWGIDSVVEDQTNHQDLRWYCQQIQRGLFTQDGVECLEVIVETRAVNWPVVIGLSSAGNLSDNFVLLNNRSHDRMNKVWFHRNFVWFVWQTFIRKLRKKVLSQNMSENSYNIIDESYLSFGPLSRFWRRFSIELDCSDISFVWKWNSIHRFCFLRLLFCAHKSML